MSNKNIRKKAQIAEPVKISNENDAVDDEMDISEDEEGNCNKTNLKLIKYLLNI